MKRTATLLTGILAVGSMTMGATAGVSNETKRGVNEQTIETNFNWTKNNNMNIEFTGHRGANAEGHASVEVENVYNINGGSWQLYTDLDTTLYGNGYIDQMIGYEFRNGEKGYTILRGGIGATLKDGYMDSTRGVVEFKNTYIFNDRFSIEGNAYFTGDKKVSAYHDGEVTVEGYAYYNYPLYQKNDTKVEVLVEGGLDPYTFAKRISDKDMKIDLDADKGASTETYYLYLQPTVKVTQTIDDLDVYGEVGYYMDKTKSTEGNSDEDGGFIKIGADYRF